MHNPLSQSFFGRSIPDCHAPSWLWPGYLASSSITLLTAQWKSGKTTLLSLLLSRLARSGPHSGQPLAGLPVTPAPALIVSEESPATWKPRIDRLGLADTFFVCQPFTTKPSLQHWLDFLAQLEQLRQDHGFQVLAFDTLASLLPEGSEENSSAALKALLPLQDFTRSGLALLLLHHPKKGLLLPGQAARGSGAFAGFVDVILEMHLCPRAPETDRRRRLAAFSRSDATPRLTVLELNTNATDYANLGVPEPDDFEDCWPILRTILEDAEHKLTRAEILGDWPDDFPKPCSSALYKWLTRAVAGNLIHQSGTGRKCHPFRYWLPYVEAHWRQQNPTAAAIEDQIDTITQTAHQSRDQQWQPLRPPTT